MPGKASYISFCLLDTNMGIIIDYSNIDIAFPQDLWARSIERGGDLAVMKFPNT